LGQGETDDLAVDAAAEEAGGEHGAHEVGRGRGRGRARVRSGSRGGRGRGRGGRIKPTRRRPGTTSLVADPDAETYEDKLGRWNADAMGAVYDIGFVMRFKRFPKGGSPVDVRAISLQVLRMQSVFTHTG
jgi:hypothetical protein